MCTPLHTHIYIHIYIYINTYADIHVYTCTHIHIHVYMHRQTHIHLSNHPSLRPSIHPSIHPCMHIQVFMHIIYIYVYVYVYVYVYTHTLNHILQIDEAVRIPCQKQFLSGAHGVAREGLRSLGETTCRSHCTQLCCTVCLLWFWHFLRCFLGFKARAKASRSVVSVGRGPYEGGVQCGRPSCGFADRVSGTTCQVQLSQTAVRARWGWGFGV